MMIMEGSKMFKTEYDLKAILYSTYNTPHKVHNINLWKLVEIRVTPVRIVHGNVNDAAYSNA